VSSSFRAAIKPLEHWQMTDREEFTQRCLIALKTSQADGDRDTMAAIIDALGKEYDIPANYPPVD
jgi:hypothetical protein